MVIKVELLYTHQLTPLSREVSHFLSEWNLWCQVDTGTRHPIRWWRNVWDSIKGERVTLTEKWQRRGDRHQVAVRTGWQEFIILPTYVRVNSAKKSVLCSDIRQLLTGYVTRHRLVASLPPNVIQQRDNDRRQEDGRKSRVIPSS